MLPPKGSCFLALSFWTKAKILRVFWPWVFFKMTKKQARYTYRFIIWLPSLCLFPGVGADMAGLSLTSAITIMQDVFLFARYAAALEKAMISVERIREYEEISQVLYLSFERGLKVIEEYFCHSIVVPEPTGVEHWWQRQVPLCVSSLKRERMDDDKSWGPWNIERGQGRSPTSSRPGVHQLQVPLRSPTSRRWRHFVAWSGRIYWVCQRRFKVMIFGLWFWRVFLFMILATYLGIRDPCWKERQHCDVLICTSTLEKKSGWSVEPAQENRRWCWRYLGKIMSHP